MPMSNLLRQLRGRPQLVTIDIAGLPRFRMETHGRSDLCISAAIEDWGHWEPSSTAIVRQLLQGRADFIDIGANIGWYTLVAAHALGANGHVHSFEPDASHVAKLKANVLVNRLGNVSVNDVALSDRAGRATLHRDPRNRGDNSLLPSATRTGSASIALARLDDYPGLGVRPLVIKIDSQGSDIDVLGGARRLLETYPHEIAIVCEISPSALAAGGRTARELAALLDALGFAAALIDRPHPRIVPMSWRRLVAMVVEADAQSPGADADFVAYRSIAGMMAPFFRGGSAASPR